MQVFSARSDEGGYVGRRWILVLDVSRRRRSLYWYDQNIELLLLRDAGRA